MNSEMEDLLVKGARDRAVTRLLQWLAGGLVAILLVLFYINSQGVSVERHQQVTQGFERLRSLHDRFLEMLVASHAGLLPNYDPLVDTLADIRGLRTQLPDRLPPATRERLAGTVARYDRLLGQLADKGEELKSHNSVLRNSLSYLPIGVSRFLSENATDTLVPGTEPRQAE